MQIVRYTIQATLMPNNKTIDGQWDATYVNQADTALHGIWIALYPNAFANDRTQYSEDLLKWGNTKSYFSTASERGSIDSLNFTVDGSNVVVDKKGERPEFVRLQLEKPLQPGDSVHIATTFFTQIPYDFEKEGFKENDFILKAWCPLVAELNIQGWQLHPYSPFLDNRSANAHFDVTIRALKNYQFASNGATINPNTFQYEGSEGLQWIASPNKAFVQNYSFRISVDSARSIVAKNLFPDVFHSGKAPEKPAYWLGQVYRRYQRPIPFIEDSLYYKNDSSFNYNRKLKLGLLYNFKQTDQYSYLFVSPMVGFNNYDKVMVGGLIHNYQLPQEPFSFALAPMYATGSKRFAGWGTFNYNIWTNRTHWNIGVLGGTSSMNEFNIPNYPKLYQRMWRFVPSINVTLLNKDEASTQKWDFGFKAFVLSQQRYTSISNGNAIAFENLTIRTNIYELKAQIQDTRKLYPYSLAAVANATSDFVRLGITGKYFFNYDASTQGVSARLFAGKLFYLRNQTTDVLNRVAPYLFTLNGPTGIYDYTFSDYFIGRNERTGWMSQQIMERDGFMKLPGSILYQQMSGGKVLGASDNWLTALNLAADIPGDYNFLKPANGTIKLFFDLGTYSDLWGDQSTTGRFLYDAGFQISLCKSLVNVYVPILYSKVFRDIYRQNSNGSGYFWKTVSFNINLAAFSPRNRNFQWPL